MNALILMYHRISEPGIDPWSLCVSPGHFAQHMEIIKKTYHPCSLSELVSACQVNDVPDNAVVVTFDDGYLDNATTARPILEKYGVPATVFVCSGCIGNPKEFWWDALERALLQPEKKLPAVLNIETDGMHFSWNIDKQDEAAMSQVVKASDHNSKEECLAKNALPPAPIDKYFEVWEALRDLEPAVQVNIVGKIRAQSGCPAESRPTHKTVSADDLVRLAQSPLIEIGAHTINHPRLPAHSEAFQSKEIAASRKHIEDVLQRRVEHFSYPFGQYDEKTLRIVRNCGFVSACTTVDQITTAQNSIHELPRMMVHNWNGDRFGGILQERLRQ